MLGCVILNYNDSETTVNLLNIIKNYDVLDKIIIVDNMSSDNSFDELLKFENKKITVKRTDHNGGYGYGNNVGIKFAIDLGCDYVIIANPDVEFEENAIVKCLDTIKNNPECAAVAPHMYNGNPAIRFSSSPIKDVLFSCLTLNKIFKPRTYPEAYFKNKRWCYVDALPGSLVMLDIKKFMYVCMYV